MMLFSSGSTGIERRERCYGNEGNKCLISSFQSFPIECIELPRETIWHYVKKRAKLRPKK